MSKTRNFKDTFWNNLRVERNVSYKEIAEYLNYSYAYASMIFTGQIMPKDLQIKQICDLFDVPFEQGKQEFKKAHTLWKSEIKRPSMKNSTGESTRRKSKKADSVVEDSVDSTIPVVEEAKVDNADIIKMLYGRLPYEVFVAVGELISSDDVDTALSQLYGKVSCKEFIQIWRALQNE